jgi:hypothetical protein
MGIYEESNYEEKEKKTHREIQRAFDVARNKNKVVNRRGGSICRCDFELSAVSKSGRCAWTRALCDEFESVIGGDTRLFFAWFTFVDISGTENVASRYGKGLDPTHLIKKFRQGLSGANYAAMIEPGLYTNISRSALPFLPTITQFRTLVSWHCHGLAWSTDEGELRRRFKGIRRDCVYQSFVPGLPGCLVKWPTHEQVAGKIAYMCKTPRESYRLFCVNPEEIDRDELQFRQKPANCRPGEHITYFSLLRYLTLDELAFGGGEGSKILRRIKKPFLDRVGHVRWKECSRDHLRHFPR